MFNSISHRKMSSLNTENVLKISETSLNSLSPRDFERKIPDDYFNSIYCIENGRTWKTILLKCIAWVVSYQRSALVQEVAWRRYKASFHFLKQS